MAKRELCSHHPPRRCETSSLHPLVAVTATFTPTTIGSLTKNLNAPHCPTNNGPTGRANGGFGSIRSLVTACRRRVAPLMLQFPLATMSGQLKCAATDQPGPRLVTPHKKARPIPAPHCTARGHISTQTQSEDSNSNDLLTIALEFIHEPRSQGQRRSFHPRRR